MHTFSLRPLALSAAALLLAFASACGAKTEQPVVQPPPAIVVSTATLTDGTVGAPYSAKLTATGGKDALKHSATGLPAGLTVAEDGALSGTPTADGDFSIVLTVTDQANQTATATYPLKIFPAPAFSTASALPGGTADSLYEADIAITGGKAPVAVSMLSGELPPGVTFDAAALKLSGTPTAAGNFSIMLQAKDANASAATRAFTLVISPALSITTATLPNGNVGSAYTQTLQAQGGKSPVTFEVVSGMLPPGLTLEAATGRISGTPTASGPVTVSFGARDGNGALVSKSFTFSIFANAPPTVATTTLPNAVVGLSYSHNLVAADGAPPYTWTVSSGTLNAGLSLAQSGAITGAATSSGPASFQVTVIDANGQSASKALTLTAYPELVISTAALPENYVGQAYTTTLSASGGQTPYSWTVVGGSLPAGVTLTSSGILSGTPTSAGSYGVTIGVTDASGQSPNRAYTLTIFSLPTLTTTALADGVVGVNYSQPLTATGGKAPLTYAITAGALPAGLSLVGSTIAGTPSATANATLVLAVTDANGKTDSKTLTLNVFQTLTITSGTLPDPYVGSSYSQTLTAAGGSSPYTWSIASGTLPAGLTLAADGTLSGSPTTAGSSTVTVKVTSSNNATATKTMTFVVRAPPSITTTSLTDGYVGQAYSLSLNATGGKSGYTWTATGALPAGVTLSTAGVLSGTPSATSSGAITFTVTDANGETATQQLNLAVFALPSITTSTLADAYVGTGYAGALAHTGGKSPVVFTLSSGTLPNGLSLSAAGALSGTPTVPGTALLGFTATDANGKTAQVSLSLAVFAAPQVSTTSLPDGTKAVAYSANVQATGGKSPLSWTLSSGTLPSGLSLASNGAISGTPTNSGTSTFSVVVTDANGVSATANLSIIVYASLTISTASLPDGYANVAYSQTLAAAGGKSPYTWSLTSGGLPSGVTLNTATGALTGTTTAAGAYNFTVTVTDANSSSASKPLTLNIVPTPSISTTTLRDGYVGLAYDATVVGQNGKAPYTFTVSTGTLPAGVNLDGATGTFSGAPTTKASYTFEITLTDSNGLTAKRTFTVGVYDAPQVTTSSPLADGYVGTASLVSFAGSGGKTPYTWALASGTLPTGLSLATTGDLTGTPTAPGTFAFSIKLTDANGQVATRSFTQQVRDTLVLSAATLSDGYVGTAYPATTLSATGGKSPYTFAPAGGSLPAGLSLSTSGTLSGTPTSAAASSFTVSVTDANNVTATRSFSITVYNAPSVTTSTVTDAYASTAYTQTLAATGGKTPLSWTLSSGALPAGLTLSTGGAISGTTTSTGSFPFTVTVTDANQVTATRSFTLQVLSTLDIATNSMANGYVGTAYSSSLTATGGKTPYTYSLTGGTMPAGLTLTGATVSGNPTSAGTANLTFTVTDGNGRTASKALPITIYAQPAISTTTLPDGYAGGSYSAQLNTTGGKSPFTFTITGGTPPAGITLSQAGVLSGTPSATGNSTFTVTATDANGVTATASLTIVVLQPLQITTSALADGYTGTAYSKPLSATGGKTAYTWSLASGSTLPAGLNLSSTGTISGTPTAAGATSFVAKVTDANGVSINGTVTIEILSPPAITNASTLADGYPSTAYSVTLTTSGGRTQYTFSAGTGLPPGVTVTSGGGVSGTPTTAGTYTFTVTATDANTVATSKQLTVIVRDTLLVTTASLPDGYLTNAYSQTLGGSGGKTPYTWSVSSGALPAGITLDTSSGALTGTPTAANTYSFTIKVTDANGVAAQKALSIGTYALPAVTSAATLPDAYRNSAYSQTLTNSGGKAPFVWTFTAGSLPAGVTLSSTGVLSGTPTTTGSSTFTAQVKDANTQLGTKSLTVTVLDGFFITTSTLADAYQGLAYSQTLAASGGLSPYTWSLASGTLPAGLTLNPSTGVISGTPTGTGSATFDIRATDSNSAQITKTFTVVGRTPPSVTTSTLPDAYVGTAFNQTLAGSGGATPYTWAVSPALPAGLSLTTSTGAISGTPTAAAASATYTFTLTDANGKTATKNITFAVYAPPTVTLPTAADAYVGLAYSLTPSVSGGKATITWSTTGTVPAGLTVSTTTGAISGTPTSAGNASFSLTATDANGRTDTKTVSFTIFTQPSVATTTLPGGYLQVSYQQDVTGTGGKTPYTWATTGTLPGGITGSTVSNALRLAGTPTASGTFSFTATLTDANGKTASQALSITVAPALAVTTASLPDGYQNQGYTGTVQATGGKAPYSFDLLSGSLPTGVTLAASGALSGTVDMAATTQTAVIRVTDANGTTANKSFTLNVYAMPAITTTSFPDGYVAATYTANAASTGGKAPLTWSISAGTLPAGLTLNASTGAITGTPTTATPGTFTLSVSDANGKTVSRALAIPVYAEPTVNALTFTDGYAGAMYTKTLTGTGGKSPFTWTITGGALPPGLTLGSSSGTVGSVIASSGITNGQTFNFTATLTDANGHAANKAFSMTVYLHVVIGAATLQNAIEGVTYRAAGDVPVTLQLANGKSPYTVNATGLPAGLSVNSSGNIVGIPNQGTAGPFTVTANVSDANGDSASKMLSLTVAAPTAIAGGGTRSTAPTGSAITDQVTIFVIGSDDAPKQGVGVRLRKNGAEFSPVKEALTDANGKVWFSGLGLNGTTDTLDITANGQSIPNTAITSINAALVTLAAQDYPAPGKRRQASGGFEPDSGKLIVFGGLPNSGGQSPSIRQNNCPDNLVQLSSATSASWTELKAPNTSGGPSPRYGAATMVTNGGMVMVGGTDCDRLAQGMTAILGDAWTYRTFDNSWQPFQAPPIPATTEGAFVQVGSTYAMLFSGDMGGGVSSQSAILDLQAGTWQTGPNMPFPPRKRAGTTYRSTSSEGWICGGTNGTTVMSDCFSVMSQGPFFTQSNPQPGLPAAREGLAMAYDPATNRIFAFGGRDPGGLYRNELFILQYNPTTSVYEWSIATPLNVPPARADHVLAFDTANNRLILYGGQNTTGNLGDVWTYENNDWTRRSAAPVASSTYTVSGAITGGAIAGGGQISTAQVGVTTSSGLRLSAYVNLNSGSGSYSISGIPSGDTITLTAVNRIEANPQDYRSILDFGTIGPITSNTTQNIAFPQNLTKTSFSSTWSSPSGWTATPSVLPAVSRANYPFFALQNGFASTAAPNLISGNYLAVGGGLSQDLLVVGTDQNAATCEQSLRYLSGIGSGALPPITLQQGPRSRTPGETECTSFGTGLIQSATNSFAGPAVDVVTADVNGDGKLDAVVLRNDPTAAMLMTFLNNGTGTNFVAGPTTQVGLNSSAIATLDFNKDGKADIAVAEQSNNRVTIYGGNGSGGFTLLALANIPAVSRVQAGDLNGDGNPDIVATSSGPGTLTVAFGNGSSAFGTPVQYTGLGDPRGLRIANLNGDAFPDVVVATHAAPGTVRIYNGSANGTLTAGAQLVPQFGGSGFYDVEAFDFDGNGLTDVIATSDTGNSIPTWTQTSPGTFTANANGGGYNQPTRLARGDFDGDNLIDVAVTMPFNNETRVLFNTNGQFLGRAQSLMAPGSSPNSCASADFDGDGRMDLTSGGGSTQAYYLQAKAIPTVADTTFSFSAPTGSQMVTFKRGAAYMTTDWVLYGPASSGTNTLTLPAVSTLAPARLAPTGQLSMWSASLTMPETGTINRNEMVNRLFRPANSVTSGGMIFRRQ